MTLRVDAPLTGAVLTLGEVPDPVFAEALVGPGLAVAPEPGPAVAVAPVAGRLAKVTPHAYVVRADPGRAVLVHLGIDTVRLGGAGFTVLVAAGSEVAVGAPVVRWDPVAVAAAGLSTVCPVIALGATAEALRPLARGQVTAGQPLFAWTDPTPGGEPVERHLVVGTPEGLHARPAALLVQAVTASGLAVTVGRPGEAPVDARSILSVLALDVRAGETLVVRAEGPGARAAVDVVAAVLAGPGGDG